MRASIATGSMVIILILRILLGGTPPAVELAPLDSARLVDYRALELDNSAREAIGMERSLFGEFPGPVWVYLGYHGGQSHGERIHAPEHCYPGQGYRVLDSQRLGDSRRLEVSRPSDQREVRYAFLTRRGSAASPWGLKLKQVEASLLGLPRDAVLLRLSTPVGEGSGQRLDAQWDALWPRVQAWFDGGAEL